MIANFHDRENLQSAIMEYNVKNLKTRLDKFLSETVKDTSRSQIQRDIEAGLVMVNGEVAKESKFVVRLNDKVVYEKSEILNHKSEISASNTPLKVLYNDHGLLIIDKPAGMTVHPGAGFKGETLVSALLYHFNDIKLVGEEGRPGIVHRLDKDTSGIILVAKTQEMYEFLKDAFAERKIKKEYIALVQGKMEKPHGFIETPIGRSKTGFRKYSTKNMVEAKESLTEYKVLEYLTAENQRIGKSENRNLVHPTSDRSDSSDKSGIDTYTLILVKLHTGRTHQIRVHMNSIGHPLIGDSLYGSKKSHIKGLNRQFLHAKKIEVQLPDKTWIEAESELPSDLKEILFSLKSKTVGSL